MSLTSTPSAEWPLKLTVTRREPVAAQVVLIELAAPDGSLLPAWEPGAHLEVQVGEHGGRQYSLCGSPADRSSYRIAVLREPAGHGGSQWMHDVVGEGDVLQVSAIRNHFRLEDAVEYRFVAGGIGITPVLPMIEEAARQGRNWSLLYGGRSRDTMAFAGDLTREYDDRVQVQPQDESGLLDLTSYVDGAPEGTGVYACGPGAMLDAVEKACLELPGIRFYSERFKAAPAPRLSPEGQAIAVQLARSGTVIDVGPTVSILDALEDSGLNLRSSCREGTCGTCEVGVLDGDIDHRDYVLDEDEKARGDVMMICVSRCHSARLVLDL